MPMVSSAPMARARVVNLRYVVSVMSVLESGEAQVGDRGVAGGDRDGAGGRRVAVRADRAAVAAGSHVGDRVGARAPGLGGISVPAVDDRVRDRGSVPQISDGAYDRAGVRSDNGRGDRVDGALTVSVRGGLAHPDRVTNVRREQRIRDGGRRRDVNTVGPGRVAASPLMGDVDR